VSVPPLTVLVVNTALVKLRPGVACRAWCNCGYRWNAHSGHGHKRHASLDDVPTVHSGLSLTRAQQRVELLAVNAEIVLAVAVMHEVDDEIAFLMRNRKLRSQSFELRTRYARFVGDGQRAFLVGCDAADVNAVAAGVIFPVRLLNFFLTVIRHD